MPLNRVGWWMVLGLAACGLPDVLAAPGLRQITLTYLGSTTIAPDETTAVVVAVEASGEALPNPRLLVTSSNTSVVEILGVDSLVGRSVGDATLTIRLLSSIFTDSVPTITQDIRVRPGGPP